MVSERQFSIRRLRQVGRDRSLIPIASWVITPLLILLGWQLIVSLRFYPEFIIPSPAAVLEKAVEVIGNGRLWEHTQVTLTQTLLGLLIGAASGMLLGYMAAKSRWLDALLSPLVVTFQSTPVVAYAPLLVIWFRDGITSKVITSALIVFFPMFLNTVVGLRNVPHSLRDLMLSLRASRWQMFTQLEVPAGLPVILGGLKVSATLAVIGAVVGEFINADAGLGFLIEQARNAYDTPLVIVSVLTLALSARLLYGFVEYLESRLLRWQRRGNLS
jgi:NitT/TauT family transport system permease protein